MDYGLRPAAVFQTGNRAGAPCYKNTDQIIMTHPGNKTIRKQKIIGLTGVIGLALFIAATGLGLVFPFAEGASKTTLRFDVGTELHEDDAGKIAGIHGILLDAPTRVAIITGHTGPEGDPQANARLSQARAETVRDALVETGIAPDRIVTRGAGGTMPVEAREGETEASVDARMKRAVVRIVERRLTNQSGW